MGLLPGRVIGAFVLLLWLFLRRMVLVVVRLLRLLLRRIEAAVVLFLLLFLRRAVLYVWLDRRRADLIVDKLDLSYICEAFGCTKKGKI